MAENQKAKIATIRLAPNLEFEGLMLPDGEFVIAATQVAQILGLDSKNIVRSVKTKLNLSSNLPKVKTELTNNSVTILNLSQFRKFIVKLALEDGNPIAKNLNVILVGSSLNQVFCDYFDFSMQ